MVLSKADMKTNCLCILRCLSVSKLVCKCNIECCGKDRKKFKKSSKNSQKSLAYTKRNLLQMSLNWKFHTKLDKRAKREKQRFENKCIILRLRLFRTGAKKKKHCLQKIQTSFSGICILSWKKILHEKRSAKRKLFSGELCISFYEKLLWKMINLEV